MKKFRTLIALLLVMLQLFTFAACDNGNGGDGSFEVYDDNLGLYDLSSCVHNYDVTDSNIDLIANGKSDYVIVYPDNQKTNSSMSIATSELKTLIKEATGIELPIKSDAVHAGSDKIISVGQTSQAKSQPDIISKVNKALDTQGYVIETKGNSVYILGNSSDGAKNGVYEFLKWQFQFETYSWDEWYILHNVKNMKLKNFHVYDIPDFMSRTPANGEVNGYQNANNFMHRMRANGCSDLFNTVDGNAWCDSYLRLITPAEYPDHPEWFSNTQICLEGQGVPGSRDALVEAVYQETVERLAKDPTKDWTAWIHMDGGKWCECDVCTKDWDKYDKGSQSAAWASVIRFANDVARKIKVWNEENCPERNIKLWVQNYGKVRFAPVKVDANKNPILDANGNYQPYSEDLILEDNIGVVFCHVGESTFHGMSHELNGYGKEPQLDRLKACMKEPLIYYWTYSAHFQDYVMPCHIVDSRADYYRYYKQEGGVAMLDMAQHDNAVSPDWGALESYVSSKLCWNVKLDTNQLVENFMRNYYKDAYSVMKKFYDDYRSFMTYLAEEKGYIGSVNGIGAFKIKELFPYTRVQTFLAYVDEALEVIEPLKISDPELYEKLELRISKESITWRYIDFLFYAGRYQQDKLNFLQQTFLNDCARMGISANREHGSIYDIF